MSKLLYERMFVAKVIVATHIALVDEILSEPQTTSLARSRTFKQRHRTAAAQPPHRHSTVTAQTPHRHAPSPHRHSTVDRRSTITFKHAKYTFRSSDGIEAAV